MSHVDYLICLHNSFIIVLRWYELFLVLHYNDNVISKLLRNHDVIDIVTHIVWIMQYESSNRENIFFQLIQYQNQFNQLVRHFNRGQKPSETLPWFGADPTRIWNWLLYLFECDLNS